MLHIETLPPLKPGSRLIIVGDIHGCLGEFNLLLEKAKFNPERDVLLLLGDLVNKGYDSVGVVRRAIQLKAKCILGNHDVALLNHIMAPDMGNENDPLWQLAQGFPQDCIAYLKSLPYAFRVPQFNLIIVHAGMNPKVPLEEQNVWELIHMRSIDEKTGQCWEDLKGTLWAQTWKGPEHVIFGHDARSGLQQCEYATGLDTGCCYGKYLTGIIYPGAEFVQVRSKFSQTKDARATASAAKNNGGASASSSGGIASPSPASTGIYSTKNAIFNTTPPGARVENNSTPSSSLPAYNNMMKTIQENNSNNNDGFTGINVADLLSGHKRVTSNATPKNPPPPPPPPQTSSSNTNNYNNNNNSSSSFNLQAFADKLGLATTTTSSSQQQQQQQPPNDNDNVMRFFSNKTPIDTATPTTQTPNSIQINNNMNNNIMIPAPKTQRQSGNATPTPPQQQHHQTTTTTSSSSNKNKAIDDNDDGEDIAIVSSSSASQQHQQKVSSSEKKLSRKEKEIAARKEKQEARKLNNNEQQKSTSNASASASVSASTPSNNNETKQLKVSSPAQQGKTQTCSRALAVRELCTAGLPRPQFESIVMQLLDLHNDNNVHMFEQVLKDSSIREAVWFDVGSGLLNGLEEGNQGDDMLIMAQDLFAAKPGIAKQILSATNGAILNYLTEIVGKVSKKELPKSGLTTSTVKETILCLKS